MGVGQSSPRSAVAPYDVSTALTEQRPAAIMGSFAAALVAAVHFNLASNGAAGRPAPLYKLQPAGYADHA